MVRNLIVFALLVAACTALPTGRISVFGNILTKGLNYRVRYLSPDMYNIRNTVEGRKIFFRLPKNLPENYAIRSIKTVQNSIESEMKIADGGVGNKQLSVAVTLPENAANTDTEFHFYAEEVKPENKPGILDSVKKAFEKYKKSEQA